MGDQLDNPEDFYPALRQVFTYDDQLYCAPKDFSTLALVINTDAWAAAGLTDADIPETWDDLSAVAAKLTTDTQVGLATGATRDRVGALMVAAGGYFVNEDQTEVTADTPENLAALEFIKSMLDAGSVQVHREHGPRVGRRGARHRGGRDDDRGQLDPRRDDQRLPRHQLQGRRASDRPERPPWLDGVHRSAGASPRRATSRTPRSTSSTS